MKTLRPRHTQIRRTLIGPRQYQQETPSSRCPPRAQTCRMECQSGSRASCYNLPQSRQFYRPDDLMSFFGQVVYFAGLCYITRSRCYRFGDIRLL
ncbi:uncharacterized protein LOC143770262 isoform X2 [Ranitomeya variabilis]|uniref:uncharacterized protein LOC143770262 isoform X2 n=1 Tax=Ranitomeya variabilis TaxID=490064 RepID=UPI004056EE75